jgi:hypothetical protein
MNDTTSKIIPVLAVGLLIAACGGAQATAAADAAAGTSPLAGVWKLSLSKSSIPAETAPVTMTTTIELEGDRIRVSEESMLPSGDIQTVTVDAALNGQYHTVSGSPAIDEASYRLVDPRTLDVVAKKGGKIVLKEHLVVAEDGATMTDEITDADGAAVATAVFIR